jgi:hypothetical protein
MEHGLVEERFNASLDALVEEVKKDRSVLAAILCGSLSHDQVWVKSDIDLVLVTIDENKVQPGDLALYADGINVHAILMPRAQFRKTAEGSIRNSFMHSFLAKGRLLFTHDATIAGLCDRMIQIGERDTKVQLLRAAIHALGPIYKAHKWFLTRGDLEYTALWILYAATPLAQIEVIGRRLLADREVIPQAIKLNPAFFKTVYTEVLNAKKTRGNVQAALKAIDGYLLERATTLFEPVFDHLREIGEARSCSELEDYFRKNLDLGGITIACEYLADQGFIGKASVPAQLTKRSNIDVQELAFFHIEGRPNGV